MREPEKENCPICGCGFIVKSDNGNRICLYCPARWNVNVIFKDLKNKVNNNG